MGRCVGLVLLLACLVPRAASSSQGAQNHGYVATTRDGGQLVDEGGANPAPTPFDFYILSSYWPPAVLPASAQSRAKHIILRHEASPGFWTHGLWPVR